jgi:hypothetical protein
VDDAERSARADANYFESMRALTGAMDRGLVREFDGIVAINTGLPVAWLNTAFVTRPLTRPEQSIRDAIAFYDEQEAPFIVRLREGVDSAAERAAEAAGLPFRDTTPGLALEPIAADGPAPPLEIRVARDIETLRDHIDVVASSFDMPPQMAETMLHPRMLALLDAEAYVGYEGGVPVASSALMVSHRVAGVYNVGCLPSHRRRGFGEAMTWHAVRRGAALGCVMSSLQASEMGRPIYERMGYRLVSTYRSFVRPEL